eukprot:CAMPEP_0201591434 /NCGR_PEP_ID=MMETSP0190_2-20130828/189312_1 /ASSEMBLY_ACC=CAM_ASM_000263 /TAXON_ID=37353 /ORGANISM="Rosalina sp." /LENGTH=57 /DNA_ID=CAMNT_0048049697 /DNA_START=29 /DNA_END=198 /DNA_ORIENTATION=-
MGNYVAADSVEIKDQASKPDIKDTEVTQHLSNEEESKSGIVDPDNRGKIGGYNARAG